MMGDEQGFTLWEVCLSLMLFIGWLVLISPFILHGNERIVQLEQSVQTYERLQEEVLREAEQPTGVQEVCEENLCLPTL